MPDLSHLPPTSPEEVKAMLARAGIALPDPLLAEFLEAWPSFEAMVRRLPRGRARFDEPAHTHVADHAVRR